MSLDPYALCPCGSGKKIKFCCSDLAPEIERVASMFQGGQRTAAISRLQQLLRKDPDRPVLLELKSTIEINAGALDEAQHTIDRFLTVHPENPCAWANRGVLLAMQGDAKRAVEVLQKAVDYCDEFLPAQLREAFQAVGQALLRTGALLSAKAHLMASLSSDTKEDPVGLKLVLQVNRLPGLPLMLQDDPQLADCQDDAPYASGYREALQAANRLRWRAAQRKFATLREQHADAAEIVRALAIVTGWLGDQDGARRGWQQFAESCQDAGQAVAAEALAQALHFAEDRPTVPVEVEDFPLDDYDQALEWLATQPAAPSSPDDWQPLATDEQGVPPLAAFVILDKRMPTASADLSPAALPRILGSLFLFGKETDRAPRMAVASCGDTEKASVLEFLQSMPQEAWLPDHRQPVEQRQAGAVDAAEYALEVRWVFPPGTPLAQQAELARHEQEQVLREKWPLVPQPELGDRTPLDLRNRPEDQRALAAAMLRLASSPLGAQRLETVKAMAAELGTALPDAVAAEEVDPRNLPLALLINTPLESLSDDQLATLYMRADFASSRALLPAVAEACLARPAIVEKIDARRLIEDLLSVATSLEASRAIIDTGREVAPGEVDGADWDLLELTSALDWGDGAAAQQSLSKLRNQHFDKPQIVQALYQVLYSRGLISPSQNPDGGAADMPAMPPAMGAAPAGAVPSSGGSAASKIWTPGSDAPAADSPGEKPTLWTP